MNEITNIAKEFLKLVVSGIISGIISWWLIKKTQFQPYILEKWLNEGRLQHLEPVDITLLHKASISIDFFYFPSKLKKSLRTYEHKCGRYNDILDKLYRRFFDEFKEALIHANVPLQEKHSIGGILLTLQWLESESKREEALQQLQLNSGLIVEIPFVGGSSTLCAITHEDCITHAEKIKGLVKDFRRRYQEENLWIEMLRLRDGVLDLNKNIVAVLPKS